MGAWKVIIERGPGGAFWLLALAAQMSGYTNAAIALALVGVAAFFLLAPACYHVRAWYLRRRALGRSLMAPIQIVLLIGVAGTWIFITIMLSAVGWMILGGKGVTQAVGSVQAGKDEGPLIWFTNLTLEGGPLRNMNVFSLQFHGSNISQREVRLTRATIVSAIKGTELPLEVVAENDVVPLNQIELIPPGSPIDLVAKFGPPGDQPGKVLGLEAKDFLETWRQFFLNAEDETRKYRLTFNEGNIAVFFPGMIGPHISKKKAK